MDKQTRNALAAKAAQATVAAIPDACWLIGLTAVAFGIGLYSLPFGIIAGGLALCFLGFVLGRAESASKSLGAVHGGDGP